MTQAPGSNGNGADHSDRDDVLIQRMAAMAARSYLAQEHGKQFGGDRDLYDEFGYTAQVKFRQFLDRYRRGGIAKRVITLPVQATWRQSPVISDDMETDEETEFEQAIKDLDDRVGLFGRLARADRLSRIGRFGVLLLGFAENGEVDLRQPPATDSRLQYLAPYHEGSVTVKSFDKDPRSPRFNLPLEYEIDTSGATTGQTSDRSKQSGLRQAPDCGDDTVAGAGSTPQAKIVVHWSRVIHIAEELVEDEVYGVPALEPIWNYLDDLDKVVGGGAESYWRAIVATYVAKIDKDADIGDEEQKQLSEEVDEFVHKLRRFMRIQGGELEAIRTQPADPSSAFGTIISAIAGTTGIPQRILTGSERGELASSQDVTAFAGMVQDRMENHVEPSIVRATIDRLREFRALPRPQDGRYDVKWHDPHAPGEKEMVEIASRKAQAMRSAFGPETPTLLAGPMGAQFMEQIGFEPPEGMFSEQNMQDPDNEIPDDPPEDPENEPTDPDDSQSEPAAASSAE